MNYLFPEIIEYQPYSICNANCSYCPVGALNRQLHVKGEPIKDEILLKLINDSKGMNIKRISPHLNCEPLLAKNLPHQINLWKKAHPNAKISLSSNCVFLTNDKLLELVEAGLDELECHYMGVNKSFHEKAMKTNFDKVTHNIINAFKLKKKRNLKINMYIFSHRMKGATLNEWYEFANKFKAIGAEFTLGPLWNRAGYYGSEFKNIKTGIIKSFNPHPCQKPHNQLAVEANGEVVLCSLDYGHDIKIGNIMNESVESIWNNKIMNKYRDGQNKPEKLAKLDLCSTCIRGGRYLLDERKLTNLVNKDYQGKFKNFAYKGFLKIADYL